MYANTAYEALYQLMGLQFQEQVTSWITSEVIFRATITIIFAVSFFTFLVHFASRYLPFVVPARRAPISKLIFLVFSLFLGISLLKVGTTSTSSQMAGNTWSQNPYVASIDPTLKDQYKVSFIFKILSGSAEELARGLGFLVDSTFAQTNPQMTAPNFFYKAMLGAAADTIDDSNVRGMIHLYTDECLSKALPNFSPQTDATFLDEYFSNSSNADQKLAQVSIQSGTMGPAQNCLDLKNYMNQSLSDYAKARSTVYDRVKMQSGSGDHLWQGFGQNYDNWVTSNLLVNEYIAGHEGTLGLEKGTELPGTGGRVFQYIERFFSMDGILSILGRRDLKGASVAASRSQELSDHLQRAPQVAGFIKMFLVGFFPILVFFLAAGKWKPLIWWWLTYLSVCLWTPIWALLYHVITNLALNVEVMQSFGKLADGVSLYAASLISSRLYQAFAVYSYLQLIIGPLFTGILLSCMRPMLRDTESDSLPDGLGTAAGLTTKAAGVLL
jgi:hypothetical protein